MGLKLDEWIRICKDLTRAEYDNVMLYLGPEGSGKSSTAYQHLKAMDPGFGPSRIVFSIPDFLDLAPTLNPGDAILLDEGDMLSHNTMGKEPRRLLSFLKDGRALRLHIGMCFPRTSILNRGIQDRVRWFIIKYTRAHTRIYKQTVTGYGIDNEPIYERREVWRGIVAPNQGEEWEAYLTMKQQHMRRYGVAAIDERPWDEGLVEELQALYAEYQRSGKHAIAAPL